MALTVARRLFRRSLKVNGANDGTILGIDHRGIGLTVAENINPFRHGLEEDAVRSSLHVDGFDRLQGLGVPHHDRAAAAKTVVRLGINRGASCSRVSNGAGRFESIEIKYQHFAPSGN